MSSARRHPGDRFRKIAFIVPLPRWSCPTSLTSHQPLLDFILSRGGLPFVPVDLSLVRHANRHALLLVDIQSRSQWSSQPPPPERAASLMVRLRGALRPLFGLRFLPNGSWRFASPSVRSVGLPQCLGSSASCLQSNRPARFPSLTQRWNPSVLDTGDSRCSRFATSCVRPWKGGLVTHCGPHSLSDSSSPFPFLQSKLPPTASGSPPSTPRTSSRRRAATTSSTRPAPPRRRWIPSPA
jgi:hypothetical protein